MNNNNKDLELLRSSEDILCPMCFEDYSQMDVDAEDDKNIDKSKGPKDVHRFHSEKCTELDTILASLDQQKKEETSFWIQSVLDKMERRARLAVNNPAEEGLLFDILFAEAWKAAQTYDPSKSTFSNWVSRPWSWAIAEVRRVKRLPTQSGHGADNWEESKAFEEIYEDRHTPLPIEATEMAEHEALAKATFHHQRQMRFIVEALWHRTDWPCTHCRRKLFALGRNSSLVPKERETLQASSVNVYARRALWRHMRGF